MLFVNIKLICIANEKNESSDARSKVADDANMVESNQSHGDMSKRIYT